ncbi:MAG: AI-2E family transporter [Lachnospiraceae bacterium]|nr:AI-2E family transporter [Lachnospiraceae bacterium]
MGFDRMKLKQIRGMIIFIAVICLALRYSDEIFGAIGFGADILAPFILGAVMAFILNLPLRGIENKLLGKWKGRLADKCKRPIGIVGSILFIVAIITLVILTVVPQIGKTLVELGNKIPVFMENVLAQLQSIQLDNPQLQTYLSQLQQIELNWDSIINNLVSFLKNGMTSMLTSTFTVAGNIVSGVADMVISFIFAIYILGQKEKLADQGKRILSAYCKPRVNQYILKVFSMAYRNFSNFISGQCLEAVILGCMFVIAMSIFGIPYAVLVGVLIAFTALIPIVGAFIGCAVGAFLIMVDDPMKALFFIVMFLILQQLEGNLVYPRVVGNSVGLPSIWVLVAVSVGGSLFGVAGMLAFIPLVSTMYMLLRDSVNERNAAMVKTNNDNGNKPQHRNYQKNNQYKKYKSNKVENTKQDNKKGLVKE